MSVSLADVHGLPVQLTNHCYTVQLAAPSQHSFFPPLPPLHLHRRYPLWMRQELYDLLFYQEEQGLLLSRPRPRSPLRVFVGIQQSRIQMLLLQ